MKTKGERFTDVTKLEHIYGCPCWTLSYMEIEGMYYPSQDKNILISRNFKEVLDLDKNTFFKFRFSNDEKVDRNYNIQAVSNTL